MEERDEQIVKKMVTTIVEHNEKIINHNQDINKFSRIVPSLMKKGFDSLNLSMFSPEVKCGLLSALGEEYRRKGNLNDAVKSFVIAGNKEKLNEVAEDYEKLFQFDNAIEVYISRLRGKLQSAGIQIRTVRGFGYMVEDPGPGSG